MPDKKKELWLMLSYFSGVLVRLTTRKRLTNSLPKLSLIRHSPPLKRRDTRSAGYSGGPVNIEAISFPGDTGESIFQVRHGENLKKGIIADGGIRTHDPKNPWSVDDAICSGINGVLARVTTCKRLINSLPKLSLI